MSQAESDLHNAAPEAEAAEAMSAVMPDAEAESLDASPAVIDGDSGADEDGLMLNDPQPKTSGKKEKRKKEKAKKSKKKEKKRKEKQPADLAPASPGFIFDWADAPTNADGELVCTTDTMLDAEELLALYRHLQLTRRLEERLINLARQSKIIGGVFRSLGQEATAVGTAYALAESDFIAPLIRDLGATLVRGTRARDVFAQHMAKADSLTRGRDLHNHYADMERGILGPISHLGDMVPVMTGVLLAARMRGKQTVGVAYVGDGTMSTGAFHEGLNFAAVQRLPLVIVAEHNAYAYSTPTRLQTAVEHLAEKAAGYGIPGVIVDGNDVVACYEAMRRAVDFARAGGGSILLEAKTYRRKGHAEHDNQSYLPEGELEMWERRDPVDRFHRHLLFHAIASAERLDEINREVDQYLSDELAAVEDAPLPDPEQAAYDVYDNSIMPPALRPPVLGRTN